MSEVSREYYGSYSVDDEDQLQFSDTLDEAGSPTFSTKVIRRRRSGRPERASVRRRRRRCGARPSSNGLLRPSVRSTRTPYRRKLSTVHSVGRARAGRLIAPDEGSHFDLDDELVATDVGID